jgi:pSer/pThr/pTyr-binding forkhead associated (FHA) protein
VSWSIEWRDPEGVTHVVVISAPFDIGREVDGIVIEDQVVSRRHARLELVGPALVLTDLGSTNGTTVNDVFVNGPVELRTGDRVGIGPTTFLVRDDALDGLGRSAGGPGDAPPEFDTVTIDPPGTRRRPATIPRPVPPLPPLPAPEPAAPAAKPRPADPAPGGPA